MTSPLSKLRTFNRPTNGSAWVREAERLLAEAYERCPECDGTGNATFYPDDRCPSCLETRPVDAAGREDAGDNPRNLEIAEIGRLLSSLHRNEEPLETDSSRADGGSGPGLPDILLSVLGDVFTASGTTSDGIPWNIYAEAETQESARARVSVDAATVAQITVHSDDSLTEEVQAVCAALVWSGIRAVRIKRLASSTGFSPPLVPEETVRRVVPSGGGIGAEPLGKVWTCTGSCRGESGLGSGWYCALKEAPPAKAQSTLPPETVSPQIERALALMRSNGFLGTRGRVLWSASDESGLHTIRVVEYGFPDSVVPYVEVEEAPVHSDAPARIYSFSAAVHALQNLHEDEVWTVGNREHGKILGSLFGTPPELIPEGATEFVSDGFRALKIHHVGSVRVAGNNAWQFAQGHAFGSTVHDSFAVGDTNDPHWSDVAADWLRYWLPRADEPIEPAGHLETIGKVADSLGVNPEADREVGALLASAYGSAESSAGDCDTCHGRGFVGHPDDPAGGCFDCSGTGAAKDSLTAEAEDLKTWEPRK